MAERTLPIVFLTSHSEREMVEKVKGITRYGYIIKNSGDFVLRSSIEMAFELFEAHETMKAREIELEAIYENAPVVMMLLDSDRRVRKSNRYAAEISGLSRQEAMDLRPGDALNCVNAVNSPAGCGSGAACADCSVRRILVDTLENGIDHSEVPVFSSLIANGARRDFSFLFSTKRLQVGGNQMTLATFVDVTKQEEAERELRISERKESLLKSIANVFLTVADEEMYGAVLKIALDAFDSEFGLFGYIAENGALVLPSLTNAIWNGASSDETPVFPPSVWGDSTWGGAIRDRIPYYGDGPFILPSGHAAVRNFMVVPIVFGNETIGVFAVANSARGYRETDRKLLEDAALFVSPILNARLQRDRNEKSVIRAN